MKINVSDVSYVPTLFYRVRGIIATVVVFLVAGQLYGQAIQVDSKLTTYKKVGSLGGNINAVGSDTLNNLMTLWSESFRKLYPNVNVQVEGKGSATAPPALIEGVAQLGPMSRQMKTEEKNAIVKKHGVEPTQVAVALDALAVFVNKNNPLDEVSLPKIDGVFSSTYKGGLSNISEWQTLVSDSNWKGVPIRLYGRNSASGTYAYFKSVALFKGDYKNSVKERPGSAAVVQSVSEDLYGIGYSGIGYLTSNVKVLNVAAKQSGKAYAPTYANVLAGNYPLSRFLYIYVIKPKGKKLDPSVNEFLRFVLSKQGQEIVLRDGYLPLPANVSSNQAKQLN